MPVRAPAVLVSFRHSLRHIGPKATIWPDTPATQYPVLKRADMVARPLPSLAKPDSADLVSGTLTLRTGDAGEIQLVFPNAVASDGQPWRSRFDPTGHLEWVELWSEGELDGVGVIDEPAPDQQQVQVHAYDGFWLLHKAYERDWICTEAPSTVMRRAASLWVPLVADNFDNPALPGWTFDTTHTNPSAPTPSQNMGGGLFFSMPANQTAVLAYVTATAAVQTLPQPSTVWRAMATIPANTLPNDSAGVARLRMLITESNGDQYGVTLSSKTGQGMAGTLVSSLLNYEAVTPFFLGVELATIQQAASYTLQLESDGMWVWAFCNGQLLGCIRRSSTSAVPTSLQPQLAVLTFGAADTPPVTSVAFTATVGQIVVETMCPFLQAASDPGDYVLPGDQTTYPWGGLTARYYNDMDLANDTDRLEKVLNPSRSQAYGLSSAAEYADQVDATIDNQANPTPGANNVNWSVIWFGAIYLRMSAGNYGMDLVDTIGQGCRLWIGDTALHSVLLDQWPFGTWGTNAFTVTQGHLTGQLPYGQGPVVRDGWYPIRIEFRTDGNSGNAPVLRFRNIPIGYTDPGGTILSSGAQTTIVPATSLSPLGCNDNRYQGVSHFDLMQQIATAFGYQFAVEPKQLEAKDPVSGASLFPGVCAPRLQEGTLTDVILSPDDNARKDGEGILNYSTALQTQDFAASMWGNGAGLQSGNAGQIQGVVFDTDTMLASLFDAQGWTDFSDAAFSELLQALLTATLDERNSPWEIVAADPMGRPRFAFTWPLPSSVLRFRWRAGDGLMLRAADVNLWDEFPRQMLVFQRNFTPEGITGATSTFVLRPKGTIFQLRRELYKVRRWQRNYQHQLVTLSGATSETGSLAAGATDTQSSHIALLPGDQLVALTVRVTYNSAGQQYGFVINGTDITGDLPAGPWNGVPGNIDLTGIWSQVSSNLGARIQIVNKSATSTASSYNYQALADVIR